MTTSKGRSRSSKASGQTRRSAPGAAASQRSARARLAAERERAKLVRRRRLVVGVPIAAVLAVVLVLVVVWVARPSGSPSASPSGGDDVVASVTSVPATALDQVGVGTAQNPPKSFSGPALTQDGKPRILYVGAEYCPYCAAERWSMVVALSRFGTFDSLGLTESSARDVFPSTPTLSFHGSSFTSSVVAFTGVETQSNEVQDGQYAPLDTLTAADQQVFSTYNRPPYTTSDGSIPFVDIGGKYLISGASYDPGVLTGMSHQQIAHALSDPSSDIAQAVDGTANLITAAICATTANAPTAVCTSAGVQAAAGRLS